MNKLNIDKQVDEPVPVNDKVITFNQKLFKLAENTEIIITFNFCNEFSAHSEAKHKIKTFVQHSSIQIEPNLLTTSKTENIKFKLKYQPMANNVQTTQTNISFECNLNLCHTLKNYCKLLKIIVNQPILICNELEFNECKQIKIDV